MKKKLLLGAAAVALLASGCRTVERVTLPLRSNPQVKVANGQISVPTLFFYGDEGEVKVRWRAGSGVRFPPPNRDLPAPIVIEGEITEKQFRQGDSKFLPLVPQNEIVDCKFESADVFVCTNKNTRPGLYKYTINVLGSDGKLISRDPPIVNMPGPDSP